MNWEMRMDVCALPCVKQRWWGLDAVQGAQLSLMFCVQISFESESFYTLLPPLPEFSLISHLYQSNNYFILSEKHFSHIHQKNVLKCKALLKTSEVVLEYNFQDLSPSLQNPLRLSSISITIPITLLFAFMFSQQQIVSMHTYYMPHVLGSPDF